MRSWWVGVLVVVLAVTTARASTTERVRFCGGWLSKALSMVCRSFNSPSWEKSSLSTRNRVKRDYGIADECCYTGCTWSDLRMYCADDINTNVWPQEPTMAYEEEATSRPLSEEHVIADRSVEAAAGESEASAIGFRTLFGSSEKRIGGVARSAPVVGTVSPLLAWGRTLHTDQPSRERLLYVTV